MMLKRNATYVLLVFLTYFLMKNTVAINFLAPAYYRLDLSIAVILFLNLVIQDHKRIVALFVIKTAFGFFISNPGVGFIPQLFLVVSNAIMDSLLIFYSWQLPKVRTGKKERAALLVSYILFCVILNGLYLIRVYALAYHTGISGILSYAARYNSHVKGFASFLVWGVAPFYFARLLLVILIVKLLKKLFLDVLMVQE